MLRSCKASAVICALLAVVLCIAPPAHAWSWNALNPAEYVSSVYYEGNIRNAIFDFGITPYVSYRLEGENGSFYGSKDIQIDHSVTFPGLFNIYPLGIYCTGGPPLSSQGSGSVAIDVSDFKSDAIINLSFDFFLKFDLSYATVSNFQGSEPYHISVQWRLHRYSATGSYMGTQDDGYSDYYPTLQDSQDDIYVFEYPVSQYVSLSSFSDSIGFIIPTVNVSISCMDEAYEIDVRSLTFSFDNFNLKARTDMLILESETLNQINDQLGSANEKLDQIIQQPEQEKQEALDGGTDVVDELTGVLPDQSQGFMSAIQQLASSMSYEGTEAKLQIPAIDIPAIPGLFGKHRLLNEQEVDFSIVVEKLPSAVITLVQVLLTLALIVFAFKELYSMISYAMTLKGGNE